MIRCFGAYFLPSDLHFLYGHLLQLHLEFLVVCRWVVVLPCELCLVWIHSAPLSTRLVMSIWVLSQVLDLLQRLAKSRRQLLATCVLGVVGLRLATAVALPGCVVVWLGKICLQSQGLVLELWLQLWLFKLPNQHCHLLNLSLLAHQLLVLLIAFFSPALLFRLVLVELFGPHLVSFSQAFDLWNASLLFNLPLPLLDVLAGLQFDGGFLAWLFQQFNLLQVNLLFTHENSRWILHLLS
jgi:hypothetical protein